MTTPAAAPIGVPRRQLVPRPAAWTEMNGSSKNACANEKRLRSRLVTAANSTAVHSETIAPPALPTRSRNEAAYYSLKKDNQDRRVIENDHSGSPRSS